MFDHSTEVLTCSSEQVRRVVVIFGSTLNFYIPEIGIKNNKTFQIDFLKYNDSTATTWITLYLSIFCFFGDFFLQYKLN